MNYDKNKCYCTYPFSIHCDYCIKMSKFIKTEQLAEYLYRENQMYEVFQEEIDKESEGVQV